MFDWIEELKKVISGCIDEETFVNSDGFIEMEDGIIYATKEGITKKFEVILKEII